MDHTYQSTMLMPASYAVLSEEEMTYLDGGADYSFNVGDYTVTLHPEVLVTYAMNVVVNGVYMLSQGSFQYFINTFKEGLSDGLSLTGVVKHNWNRMNTWSRVATVGMAGLAGYYAYAQVRSMYLSLKNLFGSMYHEYRHTGSFRGRRSGRLSVSDFCLKGVFVHEKAPTAFVVCCAFGGRTADRFGRRRTQGFSG